jgi:3-oxoacyl-[acyl-carrier protein] reductase/pteridine reductase
MNESSLNGKTILVTGAARRIGRGIALRLAEEGARVAIHYYHSESEARRTADDCGLVNNAARFTRFDPLDITERDWDFIHSVNLKAVFFCCQQAARLMKRQGEGRIVNISSLGGIRPWAEHAHYCASKAGVIMLTHALSKAFAPDITVNSVAPGVIPFEDIDERGKRMIESTPAQRGGTPAEIADAVVYFLKASNFVTGQILTIDGGLSQR